MTSAPPDLVLDAQVPDAPAERRNARLPAACTALALGLLAAIAWRLAQHGYAARVIAELESALLHTGSGIRLDFLDSLGRAATVATLLLVDAIPWLSRDVMPVVTIAAGAGFLGLLSRKLVRQGWPAAQILLLVAALLAHPVFLRAATSGTTVLLSGLAIFAVIYTCERLEHVGDVQSQMSVGLALGALVLVDPQAVYVILPLMALLPLLYRDVRSVTSGAAALLMVTMPPLIALSSFAFLHVAFSPEPLGRPFDLWASPLHGAVARVGDYDWLNLHGGDFLAPLGLLLAGTLACVPAHLILIWRLVAARAERNRPGTALAALLLPALIGALATSQMHARSAWPYLLAALMAVLVWLATKPLPDYVRRRALLLLVVGSLAAWIYPPLWAERGAGAWRAALVTQIVPSAAWPPHAGAWFDPRHVTRPLEGYRP